MSKIGMIKNLISGEVKAFVNKGSIYTGLFIKMPSYIQRWNSINMILNCNNELSSRYIRALHWAHNARNEENKQLSMIFNYFCLEALFKENENDNIQGMVRCFLGFPSGKYYNDIDKEIIKTLQNNDDYNSLIKKIPEYLDEIRKCRNDSVHSGFRSIDINNNKLILYDKLLNLAKIRCLRSVQYSIINTDNPIKTLPEFKEKAGHIFNKTIKIDDILNNVVDTLNYDREIDNDLCIIPL